ncbi:MULTISPECIES: cell division protein ZapA [Nonlabens]|uniref:Cell division protein ZapA n=2 Tax=Nonlabens ulvanivorans TaxID=906888 RepID=A0A084JY30_NONUL|nr:cell division protein ZapA [Nonlabens ulvanivorans]KEZ93864.1 cell division protein ZapA [Nonlabens ulvanivorans]PRX14471.1 cell division protein ZapA [Nonlabens ulvanivorans]
MADKLKIKISIADRVYPLTIDPSREEGLRKAAKNIEAMIKQLESSYAVRDKQDVLAMCALQFAAKAEQINIDSSEDVAQAQEQLEVLSQLLSQQLS